VRRFVVAAVLALAARAAPLAAQVVDTTRADTLARDTTDYTALYLKSVADARRLVPVVPRIGATALLPPRTRLVLDRDSIIWQNAETVSDLLTKVPGVFLLRGGWAGRPELPTYQAHGATSVEYLLDGIPYLPIGQDSVMVDPSMLPLSFLDRVEIEKVPGQLRVYMFTHRHDRQVPYSRIGIGAGDLQIARYQGVLEKRSARGLGFAAAFDHFSVPAQRGEKGSYSNTQGWLRLEYVPSARAGAELQVFSSGPDREPVLASGDSPDTLSRARNGNRRDLQARIFFAGGHDGLGPRLDLVASRTSWTDHIEKDSTRVVGIKVDTVGTVIDTVADTTYTTRDHTRGVTQAGAVAAYRLPRASLEGTAFWRSTWTPLDVRVRGGLAPTRFFTASLEGVYLKHDGSRTSKWATARAGIRLPLGWSASAVWRKGSEVASPAILADPAQDLDDRSLTAGWRWGFGEIEGSYSSNAGFRPIGYAQYPQLPTIAPSGRTEWLTVNARIAPRQWIVLDGWYSTPQGRRPEGQPPTHSIVNATIQSKFLPTFPSGIFNLKLQISMEGWSPGVLGRDSLGTAVELRGATFFRGYIGLQIGSFTVYYDRYNLAGTRLDWVRGMRPPPYASTFAVRWEFLN
jgi:TonB-dependent receptor-like protein